MFVSNLKSHEPLTNVCAFLHGYHSYAHDPGRAVSTYHYCAHLNEGTENAFLTEFRYAPMSIVRIVGSQRPINWYHALSSTVDIQVWNIWCRLVYLRL
jgi:hypothetical protein